MTTTQHGPNPKLAAYLATCDTDDPLVIANRLIDRALVLQDEGRMDEADDLLDAADKLLA